MFEILAGAAFLLALWIVFGSPPGGRLRGRVERLERLHMAEQHADFSARLRALEEDAAEREKVWRSIVTIENDQPWKDLDLLRAGGGKPEVKNVERNP